VRHTIRFRRGATGIYLLAFLFLAGIAFCTLAVDFGRIQVAKTELQRTADAAARAGASGIGIRIDEARKRAGEIITHNRYDGGKSFSYIATQDILPRYYDWKTNTVRPLTTWDSPNAVEVTLHLTDERNNPVPLVLGKAVPGLKPMNLTARSVARLVGGEADVFVDATTNPYGRDGRDRAAGRGSGLCG
jgi:Flp pilus assembly protein TadG